MTNRCAGTDNSFVAGGGDRTTFKRTGNDETEVYGNKREESGHKVDPGEGLRDCVTISSTN